MTRPTQQSILDGEVIAPWPNSPQENALRSKADVVIYGGAAGGGKSYSLLLAALRGYGDKHYRAALFRRTFPQLSAPKALIDESRMLYPHSGAEYNESQHTWKWGSGAWLKFSHLQHDKNLGDWDGAQLAFVGLDQLEQFHQRALFYLQGRCRAPDYGGKCQVFATCNPAPEDHWLTKLIDWWLMDAPDGIGKIPHPDRSGVVRYLFREGDRIIWTTKDAKDEDGEGPMSITFIAAQVEDNPAIMEKDRGYLQRLNSMSFVDRMEKKEGRWGVSSTSGPFARHQIQIRTASEIPPVQWVRYWDLADTEPHEGNPDPCHTAGAKVGVFYRPWSYCGFGEEQGDPMCGWWEEGSGPTHCPECGRHSVQSGVMPVCVVDDATWFRLSGSKKKGRMVSVAQRDGKGVIIALELEPGSTGKEAGHQYATQVFPRGHRVELDRPTGAKAARHSDLVPLAETGRLWLVDGDWNADFIRALEEMHPLDVADALAGGFKVASKYQRRRSGGGSNKPRRLATHKVIDLGL